MSRVRSIFRLNFIVYCKIKKQIGDLKSLFFSYSVCYFILLLIRKWKHFTKTHKNKLVLMNCQVRKIKFYIFITPLLFLFSHTSKYNNRFFCITAKMMRSFLLYVWQKLFLLFSFSRMLSMSVNSRWCIVRFIFCIELIFAKNWKLKIQRKNAFRVVSIFLFLSFESLSFQNKLDATSRIMILWRVSSMYNVMSRTFGCKRVN